jgi:hypothetical protein
LNLSSRSWGATNLDPAANAGQETAALAQVQPLEPQLDDRGNPIKTMRINTGEGVPAQICAEIRNGGARRSASTPQKKKKTSLDGLAIMSVSGSNPKGQPIFCE